jgi:hypothetical protein
VLFEQRFWAGLADGSVTVTFRRWKRPQAVAGHRYRTPAGMVEVDAVTVVSVASIDDVDARQAGYRDATALRADLAGSGDHAYRVAFHHAGADPRTTLAQNGTLDAAARAELDRRLARLDRDSPWTQATLGLIAERPGVSSADLAATLGRERAAFKLDVRKLKALGLTESLEVGYRLSPRGAAYLTPP